MRMKARESSPLAATTAATVVPCLRGDAADGVAGDDRVRGRDGRGARRARARGAEDAVGMVST